MAAHKIPLEVRLAKWTERDPVTGCWNWTGKLDKKGYGHIKYEGRDQSAAKVSYVFAKGPLPSGTEISHTCVPVNPRCVNPDHLVAETHKENLARREWKPKGQRYKVKCKHCGVEKTHTRWKGGEWSCRECNADRAKKWREENADRYKQWFVENRDHINKQRRERRRKHRGIQP